jgi:NADH:ubiquinone oxidoreductase subunit 6 (subunit J)
MMMVQVLVLMSLVVLKVIGEEMMALGSVVMMIPIEDGGIIRRIVMQMNMIVIVIVVIFMLKAMVLTVIIIRLRRTDNNPLRDVIATTTMIRIDLLPGLSFKVESVGLNRTEPLSILVEDNEDWYISRNWRLTEWKRWTM